MLKYGIQDSVHIEYNLIKALMTEKEIIKIFKDILIINIFIYYLPSILYYKIIPESVSLLFYLNLKYYYHIVNIFWYFPIFIITQLSNLHFYSKIIYYYSEKNNNRSFDIKYISQTFFYQLCYIFINFSINLIYYIPHVGNFLYLLSVTFFYSFYCYDYKYNIYKIDYNSKIYFYEKNWAYFLGNGLPFGIILLIFNTMEAYVLISCILPIMIINSFYNERKLESEYIRVPFFTIPKYIINILLKEGYQKMNC